ncbi:MAG: sugar-binding protein [Cytophagales bacterium]|nr:sugar-binding protein [Armatimonadota bacterium]
MAALAGCTPSGSDGTATGGGASPSAVATSGGSGSGSGKKLRLAFVTNNASDFWTIARKGTEKAAKELPNVEIDFQLPSEGTAADQKRVVDDLLSKGVDGMAISPVDPANQTQLLNDVAKQVLLVTQDSDAPKSDRACYIGTDNVAAGRQAGGLIKEALPQGGKIMLFVGKKDAQNAAERIEGIREALKGSSVEILDIRTDDTDRVKAKSNVADTLVQYPDIAALVGIWSYNGPAIVNAVKESNKAGKVKIVCFDEEDETIAGIKSGAIFATVVQQPFEFGYESIKNMAAYLNGDKSVFPADKKKIVPTQAITQKEIAAFEKKLNELRGRTAGA